MARDKEFYEMLRNLETVIARKECRWRGFASYSDLSVLASSMTEIWSDVLLPALAVSRFANLNFISSHSSFFLLRLSVWPR